MNVTPMVAAILALHHNLPPVTDELRKRVQSIRVRSLPDARGSKPGIQQPERNSWRNKQVSPLSVTPSSTSYRPGMSPGSPFRLMTTGMPSSSSHEQTPRPSGLTRVPSFFNSQNATSSGQSGPPARYVSKFHNGGKTGDDKILNTVILNKLNVFSVKTYDNVKQFLFQILGSDQKEFIREFTWLVFRKAAAEDKFCGLFAKLLSEIKQEYPVIMEEMQKLHTTYLDIWTVTDGKEQVVDRRCRLGYSQFLAELTALGILDLDSMKLTLQTLKSCIIECLSNSDYITTIEEYMECLRQLCGTRVPKDIKFMIRELLISDLESWIAEPRDSVPGLSNKSRFACMDLRDLLVKGN
jgi:hypothetical protein